MELNFKKAFTSPFANEKWYLKLFILFFSLFIPIFSPICFGYIVQFAHNEIHDEQPLLPDMKLKLWYYFVMGLKYLVITFAYAMFLIIPLLLFVVFNIPSFLKENPSLIIPIVIIAFILLFTFGIMMMFALGMFADNFIIRSAFNLKKIFSFIKSVINEIIIITLISVALGLSLNLFKDLIPENIFGLTITLLLQILILLISVNLQAQMYKIAKRKVEIISNAE